MKEYDSKAVGATFLNLKFAIFLIEFERLSKVQKNSKLTSAKTHAKEKQREKVQKKVSTACVAVFEREIQYHSLVICY